MKTFFAFTIILGLFAGLLLADPDCTDVEKESEPFWWSWFGSGDFHETLCNKKKNQNGAGQDWGTGF